MKNLLGLLTATMLCGLQVLPSSAETSTSKASVVMSNFKNEALAVPVKPGWFVANKMERDGMYLLQLLPPGGNAQNAPILINVVTYAGLQNKTSARSFAKQEQANAPRLAKPGKMDFKFLDEANADDVTYQLSLTGNPKFPDQFEVHRVLKGKDGLHAIIYHVQPANPEQSKITEMLSLVKGVKLVEPVKEAAPEARKTRASIFSTEARVLRVRAKLKCLSIHELFPQPVLQTTELGRQTSTLTAP